MAAIKSPKGWPKLKRDWIGLRVRSTRAIGNGAGRLPEGTKYEIVDYSRGCTLRSDPCCAQCGYQQYVTRVLPCDLELLPEGE